MKKSLLCFFVFCLCLFSRQISASPQKELFLKKINVAETQKLFKFFDYEGEKGYLMVPGYNYPPIFFEQFPSDFNKIKNEQEQRALFIKILAPLALKLNQEILAERKQIEDIYTVFKKKGKLNSKQQKLIEEKAHKYDIFTRLKGDSRYKLLFKELLQKVNIIPPSIMITAAAMETDWGNSQIVAKGNSLYKTLIWHTDKGLKPSDEADDDSYRIKVYPNLYSSMSDFALKLNSDLSFKNMRYLRQEVLSRGSILQGTMLAHTLIWNSPLKNYAGIFEYTLAYYELNIIDKSSLDSKMIDKKLSPELISFLKK